MCGALQKQIKGNVREAIQAMVHACTIHEDDNKQCACTTSSVPVNNKQCACKQQAVCLYNNKQCACKQQAVCLYNNKQCACKQLKYTYIYSTCSYQGHKISLYSIQR